MKRKHLWTLLMGLLPVLAGCEGGNAFVEQPLALDGPVSGSIRGTVTAAGAGVGGAEVTVANGQGPTVVTTADGRYRIVGLAAGLYRVSLRIPPGFDLPPGDSTSRTASVRAGQVTVVNWTLRTSVGP